MGDLLQKYYHHFKILLLLAASFSVNCDAICDEI